LIGRRRKVMRSSSNAKGSCESREEDVVVSSVEGSGKVKEYKSRDFLLITGKEKVVGDAEQCGFTGVEFTIGGLVW
jgi:hypothetical protein